MILLFLAGSRTADLQEAVNGRQSGGAISLTRSLRTHAGAVQLQPLVFKREGRRQVIFYRRLSGRAMPQYAVPSTTVRPRCDAPFMGEQNLDKQEAKNQFSLPNGLMKFIIRSFVSCRIPVSPSVGQAPDPVWCSRFMAATVVLNF